ncbi:hypothetical protein [uncultured Brevundimonas sp.]|uniref:hypothetical protein n=1 Tax=uncultured Brevundimonas sp. TaxID=213418 RepID=UPI0030EC94F2|tara:strand:+ start:112753 stop:113118 length:366 start_codon:yes stop_codon:yes gene_type:complete
MNAVAIIITLAIASPVAAQTPSMSAQAKAAVVESLRDPDSARFRSVRYSRRPNGQTIYCGEVNARNAMGGYTGYVRFISSIAPNGTVTAEIASERNVAGSMIVNSVWGQVCDAPGVTPVTF